MRRPLRRLALVLVVLVSALGVLAAPTGPVNQATAACAIAANLGLGSRGAPVQCLQATLNALGYNSGPVDGAFGGMTFRAVVGYQRAKGLVADGVVGRQTGTSLGIWGAANAAGGGAAGSGSTGGGTPSGAASCKVNTSLRSGSRGEQVRCLQSRLAAVGYTPGRADGVFGNQTRAAVISYQRAKGLFVDGIAGRQTATSLGIWGTPAAGAAPASGSCAPPAGVPATARQVVVVTSAGTRADVDLLVNSGAGWSCARSNMNGRVGRNGVRALSSRRSGDGTTPGGIFPLGAMTAPDGQTFQFFGNGVNPGVRGTWRQVKAGDCWVATPNTAAYNTLVSRSAAQCASPDEYLPNFTGSYSRAAIIGANIGPNRSGKAPGEPPLAAAIFLHRHSYDGAGNSRPTSGCVSLNNNDLVAVLQQLRPAQAYFVIR